MAASSILMTATWLYAAGHGLLRPTISGTERRVVTARSLVTSAAFLVSVPAAFVGLAAAMACWLVLLPAAGIVASRRRSMN
jgi:ABC-type dipeptide/oligopeptide/nickel transport system permease component